MHGDLRVFKGIGFGVEYNRKLLEMFKEREEQDLTHIIIRSL